VLLDWSYIKIFVVKYVLMLITIKFQITHVNLVLQVVKDAILELLTLVHLVLILISYKELLVFKIVTKANLLTINLTYVVIVELDAKLA